MGVFDDMDKVTPQARGQYAQPGNYVWEIKELALLRSQKKKSARFYVIKLLVLDARPLNGQKKGSTNARDSIVSRSIELPGEYDLGKAEVKAFLIEAYKSLALARGKSPDIIKNVDSKMATRSHTSNILIGVKIGGQAVMNAAGTYTQISWYAVQPNARTVSEDSLEDEKEDLAPAEDDDEDQDDDEEDEEGYMDADIPF